MSLQNVDLTSNYIVNLGTGNQPVNKVFLQRLNWNFGSGKGLVMSGDRITILNSTFTQAINYQNGNAAQKTGGMGPIHLAPVSNLRFKNNVIKWATDGNSLEDVVNAVIENNVFTRSASDYIIVGAAQLSWPNNGIPLHVGDRIQRVVGGQLSINFGKNVVVQNNVFAVSDGVLKYNWSDDETIQNEAGGANPREDTGTVTASDASSVTDNSKCAGTCAWRYYQNSMVVIVSGAGAGQWRHITANAGNKFTTDRPFDVIPAVGDHFTISVPAYENALIRSNTMSNNPAGIDLYHGAMLNVSVVGNTLTNNGGIDLTPSQRNTPPISATNWPFNVSRNIEINGNTLTDTTGLFAAYISVSFQFVSQTTFWGKSALGVEVRNNQIVARAGATPYLGPEGYQNRSYYQNPSAPYVEQGTGALIGTVFQGDKCTNCLADYTVTTGTIDTTIWNPVTTTSPGLAATLVKDFAFAATTKTQSIGTLVGHD